MTPQSDQVSRQREREAFENWAVANGFRDLETYDLAIALGFAGYVDAGLDGAWDAWQARAALALPSETPELGHQIDWPEPFPLDRAKDELGRMCARVHNTTLEACKAAVEGAQVNLQSHQIERDGKESGAVGEEQA